MSRIPRLPSADSCVNNVRSGQWIILRSRQGTVASASAARKLNEGKRSSTRDYSKNNQAEVASPVKIQRKEIRLNHDRKAIVREEILNLAYSQSRALFADDVPRILRASEPNPSTVTLAGCDSV